MLVLVQYHVYYERYLASPSHERDGSTALLRDLKIQSREEADTLTLQVTMDPLVLVPPVYLLLLPTLLLLVFFFIVLETFSFSDRH